VSSTPGVWGSATAIKASASSGVLANYPQALTCGTGGVGHRVSYCVAAGRHGHNAD